jgi:signal transduction histidine kinase
VTLTLALVHWALWRQGRGVYHGTWVVAWTCYALRLVFISLYLVDRREVWLFAHQAATGFTALALLWAALQLSQHARWQPAFALVPLVVVAASAWLVFGMHDMATAGITSAVLLSGVTLWTAAVFARLGRRTNSGSAYGLALTFGLWGLHHLDYPLLRKQGSAVLIGVFVDVLFIVAAAIGSLALVVGAERRSLAARTSQLEQLTRLLLRAQEDERRRIARELHDEAGQMLTAVKIDLGLAGHLEAGERVKTVLQQIRDVSNLLRPSALDDLGLEQALRALVDDFARRTRIAATFECDGELGAPPDAQVAIYRMVQEALTNVVRHADARRVTVAVAHADHALTVAIEDDGRGAAEAPTPHLGLLGMTERIAELGGALVVETRPGRGFRVHARLPVAESA